MQRAPFLLVLGLFAGALAFSSAPAAAAPVIITQQAIVDGTLPGTDAAGFPGTISLPGSYRLGSNITVPNGKVGIEVITTDVTIDLDGYRISGGPAGGAQNALSGISTTGDRLTVKNGTITGFRTAGIFASDRAFLVVTDMRVINSAIGIENSRGSYTRIANSIVSLNYNRGINCTHACQLEGSIVSNNNGYGIVLMNGTILGNTFIGNALQAISGAASPATLIGYGNNTFLNNNGGQAQNFGNFGKLFPNACVPSAC